MSNYILLIIMLKNKNIKKEKVKQPKKETPWKLLSCKLILKTTN